MRKCFIKFYYTGVNPAGLCNGVRCFTVPNKTYSFVYAEMTFTPLVAGSYQTTSVCHIIPFFFLSFLLFSFWRYRKQGKEKCEEREE